MSASARNALNEKTLVIPILADQEPSARQEARMDSLVVANLAILAMPGLAAQRKYRKYNQPEVNHKTPLVFQGECQVDDECSQVEACENYYCVNPCKPATCTKDYFCKVIKHVPTCGRKYTPAPQEVSQMTL